VFATGFLGNPASYYGHMLLKFNVPEGATHTTLLDETVNYGAIMEGRHDSQVEYIVRSLVGGYDAGFSHIHFFYHDHTYGDEELRDLWEYRLVLSRPEVDLVVAHAWEVLGKRYTYYFFRGNCAYRLAELVGIIEGVDIVPPARPWTIPQATVQRLAMARRNGAPLLAEVVYHPSRQSRFYDKYLQLSDAQAGVVTDLALDRYALTSARFSSQDLPSRQAELDALMDYYQVVAHPIERAEASAKLHYQQALATRLSLPPAPLRSGERDPPGPETARAPGWLQVGYGHKGATGNEALLRVRAAYYDPLDFESGHVGFGSLRMGDTQLAATPHGMRLDRLEIMGVESLNPGISNLPGDSGDAWRLALGAEQAREWCRNCLVGRAQGDIGLTHHGSRQTVLGLYLGGALQNDRAGQGPAFGRATASLMGVWGPDWRARFEYEFRAPVLAHQGRYGVTRTEARWRLARNRDLRIRYAHDGTHIASVAMGWYW
jgi:hypothetical protein